LWSWPGPTLAQDRPLRLNELSRRSSGHQREDSDLAPPGGFDPAEPLPLNVFSLILGRRSFAGSAIGGIRETQEMLDFCAEHQLGAETEVIPAGKINEACERVLASDVRYRFVIDAATLVCQRQGKGHGR
jgi:hypothetical protein